MGIVDALVLGKLGDRRVGAVFNERALAMGAGKGLGDGVVEAGAWGRVCTERGLPVAWIENLLAAAGVRRVDSTGLLEG
jgi:hypothetical protein